MKRSHLFVFCLVIVLTSSFSCFGMKKEKGEDPGCCGAAKKTATFVCEKAQELVGSNAASKDIEMGTKEAPEESRRCLTSFDKKRAALVTALLALSVAGGGGAYIGLHGSNAPASPAEAAPELTPAIPLQSPSISLSPAMEELHKRMVIGHRFCEHDPCRYVPYMDVGVSLDGKRGKALISGDCYYAKWFYSWLDSITCQRGRVSDVSFDGPDHSKYRIYPYKKGEPVPGLIWIYGDNVDSDDGECQVRCVHRQVLYRGGLFFYCTTQEACKLYGSWRRPCTVDPNALTNLTCSFNEEKRVQNLQVRHQKNRNRATRPTQEWRPKQQKHCGNKR